MDHSITAITILLSIFKRSLPASGCSLWFGKPDKKLVYMYIITHTNVADTWVAISLNSLCAYGIFQSQAVR